MARTRGRPLPRGATHAAERARLEYGVLRGRRGYLAAGVNVTAAALAAATIVIYGLIYTPLKRRTRWATEVGSLSGALPALLGNAAAGDLGARPGLVLTSILLLWQMPHFFAIGWRHRDDYRAAGFPRRAWRFRRDAAGRDAAAARLFAGSLLHLPIVMLALLVDRLGPW
jgi:protoheme IX farnesyltransferase